MGGQEKAVLGGPAANEEMEEEDDGDVADEEDEEEEEDWPSIFEPAPNSWHEYEHQCLRLVSFAVIEACSENPSQRPHAESMPEEALLLASAAHALEDIEEQVDGRTNNTQHKNSKKRRV